MIGRYGLPCCPSCRPTPMPCSRCEGLCAAKGTPAGDSELARVWRLAGVVERAAHEDSERAAQAEREREELDRVQRGDLHWSAVVQ